MDVIDDRSSTWASASVLKGWAETGTAKSLAKNEICDNSYTCSHLFGLLASQTSGTRKVEFVVS